MQVQPDNILYEPYGQYKRCGCYCIRPQQLLGVKPRTHVAMPLKHIDYNIEITNGLCSITLNQNYYNPTDKYLELEFSFPVDPKSCIYKFVAEFGKKRIEGVVKEKEEAKRQYKEAVFSGKQAVYAQIDPKSSDIMNMEIGNVAPGEEVNIEISYLQELNIEQNSFYQFHLPATISPRFMDSRVGVRSFYGNNEGSQQQAKGSYSWNFKITLQTTRKIVMQNSPSHKLQTLSSNETDTQIVLVMEQAQKPNKDLFFYYSVKDFHLPSYVLGRSDLTTTVAMSFIPKFCELSLDDAMKALLQHKQFQTDIDYSKGEYVFLLDRSGSMGGSRIEEAKQALTLFLQSLPSDSYFNVVSFGSAYSFMFASSVKYNKQNLNKAVNNIKKMGADMGGTYIYEPLRKIFMSSHQKGYPLQIFLLTDGGVTNTQGVIELVKNQTKTARCHSIGIGNGCSEALIKGCAEKGKGKFIFISDSKNSAEKIIGLLQETLTPVIDSFELKYDKKKVHSIVPNPQSLPYILKNQVVNFYVTFKGHLENETTFTFKYTDSKNKVPFASQLMISPEKAGNFPFVDKMAHYKIIKGLEEAAKSKKTLQDFMYYVKVKDYKQEAIDQSVKAQVLSEYTAFICVNKELVDGKFQEISDVGKDKVKVEPMRPHEMDQLQKLEDKCYDLKKYSLAFNCQSSSSGISRSHKMMDQCIKYSAPPARRQVAMCKKMKKSAGFGIGNMFSEIGDSIKGIFVGSKKQASTPINQMPEGNLCFKVMEECDSSILISDIKTEQLEKKKKLDWADISDDESSSDSQHSAERRKKDKKKKFKNKKQQKNLPPTSNKPIKSPQTKELLSKENLLKKLLVAQNVDGSFDQMALVWELFPDKIEAIKRTVEKDLQGVDFILVVSYLCAGWLMKHFPQKQYSLISKKAMNFVKNSGKLKAIEGVLGKFLQ